MGLDNISKVLADKYFNQNLICFIMFYIGVIVACKYNICYLCYICYGLLILTTLSLILTLLFYTWEYYCKKYYKVQKYKEGQSHSEAL